MAITNKQREILDHTAHGAAGGFYCGDSVDMQVLVRMGLMVSMGKKSFCPDEYFALTAAGRKTLSAFNLVFSSCCKHFKAQIALQDENARLKALLEHSKTQLEYDELQAENAKLKELLKAADCPNCDGSGSIPVQVASYQLAEPDWEQQQCQWCDEREQALKG